jgi:hypothetical protein
MSKKITGKLSGGAVPDDQGNKTWVWKSDTAVDTAVVRALGEGLALDGASNQADGANPYDQSSVSSSTELISKRRTLDDMRLLSETIKRSKHWRRS